MPGNISLRGEPPVKPRPFDYALLAQENVRRYGTDSRRYGRILLADRYTDRTHFIYELLQNAEDALRKRSGWAGSRAVRFVLSDSQLRVFHFGKPFDEFDVRGICGIDESTKDLTAIGRFGIGFKSVYAFTDRPEVHSGRDDFAIEDFVRPVAVPPIERDLDETVIVIPLHSSLDVPVIAAGLAALGPNALLFLREIDQIEWSVQNGPSGLYRRDRPSVEDGLARQVRVIGERTGDRDVEHDWLLFSRPMDGPGDSDQVNCIELAFRLKVDPARERRWIRRISRSMLYVFFPTVIETHLGFLLQGPLRTTPSRDAVPPDDEWNIHCVQAAGDLLADALRWLREHRMLNASALNSLPLDRSKFEEGMFMPLYEQVKATLSAEPLLPAHHDGYLSAGQALLARGQDLRELVNEHQLTELFPATSDRGWVTGAITQDRTPELRQYLMRELGVQEIGPDTLLGKLNAEFLEQQTDAWVGRLYAFLGGQPSLRATAALLPLVRVTDGAHVRPHIQGVPQAFLAGNFESDFPTVRPEICRDPPALAFLVALGLTVPDRVDDVLLNVLPKYGPNGKSKTLAEYAADVTRIVAAFKDTDSRSQREKLVGELRGTAFVLAIPAAGGRRVLSRPGDTVLPTDRLKELLSGIEGALVVDDRQAFMQGQDVRDLLETCGTARHLRLVRAPGIGPAAMAELRKESGHAETSGQNDRVSDLTLFGLKEIIARFAQLDLGARRRHAEHLWDELALIADRRGKSVFTAQYTWTHYGNYRRSFPATFVRILNETPWVPGPDNELYPPGSVLFDSLGWGSDDFLLAHIRFKPPIIAQLAQEAGFEPGALDLLKRLRLTSEAELRARLGIEEPPAAAATVAAEDGPGGGDAGRDSAREGRGASGGGEIDGRRPEAARGSEQNPPGATVPGAANPSVPGADAAADNSGADTGNSGPDSGSRGGSQPARIRETSLTESPDPHSPLPQPLSPTSLQTDNPQSQSVEPQLSESGLSAQPGDKGLHEPVPETSAERSRHVFISYIAVQPDDDPIADPDGLEHAARMGLEEAAIIYILQKEPGWQRTPPGNPGYDLFKSDASGEPCQWCEVKAMTGSLDDRPVGLSQTQFEFAQAKRANAWLYIVERASSAEVNLVRIQDPAGLARTFTFDHGWRAVALPAPSRA
jgi:hypothetical protein